jgi:hypothetical protein
MRNKLVFITLLFALLIISFTGFYLAIRMEYETLEFEDDALELAVLEELNLTEGPLYRHQVDDITTLNLSNKGIEYLNGIEALKSLRVLNLENNQVRDLSPLQALNNLEILNLRNNQIIDLNTINIESIENLPSLRELNLRHNVKIDDALITEEIRLYDLTPLSNFTQLERLILRDNDIQSLDALSELTNLIELDISQNPIESSSFEVLSQLFQLEILNLRETNITDLTVIAPLRRLTYLNLHSNINIETIEPLGLLTSLEVLILENVEIKNELNALSSLENLYRLNVRNTQISDLRVLETLMENGALQDQPLLGVYADIDIRDNPIPIVEAESSSGYNPIAPYWANITYKAPYVLPINPSFEVLINEFAISNGDTISDYDGEYSDWIELYNPNDYAVDLTGYFLSDDMDLPLKWQFPDGSTIEANGYLLIFASTNDTRMPNGELHTNFALSQTGEAIILTNRNRQTLVDQTIATIVPRNSSYGRLNDGSNLWGFFDRFNITPGSTNNNASPYTPVR